MEIALTRAEIFLQDNHPVSLRSAMGVHVICTEGIIWITVAGHTEDIFLTAGQSHRLENNGLTLIESIGRGGIRLDTPRRARLFQWTENVPALIGRACRRITGSAALFDFDRHAATGFSTSLAK